MSNLKKMLALVLALVMSLSLVTMANADFSDAAKVEHKEAVEVMAKIGVLNGYEDGTFRPEGTLTRAEAAKIIAYVLLGDTKSLGTTTEAPFTDVPAANWAAPAVAYCVNKGIINGMGDGTYAPAGKLTGYSFAKMLLVAVGVKGEYTGTGWTVAVADAADEADLLEGLDNLVLSADITRDQAAQMALNALKYTDSETTYCVKYNGKIVEFDNKSDALLYAGLKDGAEYFEDKDYSDTLLADVFKVDCTDGHDPYGRPATTYSHEDWDADMTYADEADYTFVVDEDTTLAKAIEDNKLTKKITAGTIPADYNLYVGSVVELFVDSDKDLTKVVSYVYILDEIDTVEKLDKDDDEDAVADGATVTIDTKSGESMLDIQIENYDAKTYVEGAKIMAPVVYTASGEAGAFYPTYDKDFTESGKKWVVVDTEIVDGKDGKVTAVGSDYFKVDGVKYVNSKKSDYTKPTLADEGTFYLDPNNFVIGYAKSEDSATIDDVVYVVATYEKSATDKYGTKTITYYAQVVDLKGEVSDLVIGINEVENENDDTLEYGVANLPESTYGLYTYKTYTAKKEVEKVNYKGCSLLTAWTGDGDDYYAGAMTKGTELKADSTKADGYRLNSKTNYILLKDSKADLEVTVKTGGVNVKSTAAEGAVIYTKTTGNSVANYVILPGSTVGSASFDDVIYVDASASTELVSVDDADCVQFEAYAETGKKVTITVAEADAASYVGKGVENAFYTYEIDDDGIYKLTAIDPKKDAYVVDEATGIAMGETFKSYYGDLLTTAKLDDVDTAKAVIIDLHDTDAAGQYNKSVKTLAAMKTAVDKKDAEGNKIGYAVTMDIYGDEDTGAVLIVVTDVSVPAEP